MGDIEHCWRTMDPADAERLEAALLKWMDEDEAMSAIQVMREYTVPAASYRGAVSREHAIQAIGWLSAEVALHGTPELGPEWLELWERALAATGGQ